MSADRVNKTEIAQMVAEDLGMSRADVGRVIDRFFEQVRAELNAGNEVAIAGNIKFGFRVRKAVKKGTLVFNPMTQEKQPSDGKPATIVVKATPLKSLKTAAPGAGTKVGKQIVAGVR